MKFEVMNVKNIISKIDFDISKEVKKVMEWKKEFKKGRWEEEVDEDVKCDSGKGGIWRRRERRVRWKISG